MENSRFKVDITFDEKGRRLDVYVYNKILKIVCARYNFKFSTHDPDYADDNYINNWIIWSEGVTAIINRDFNFEISTDEVREFNQAYDFIETKWEYEKYQAEKDQDWERADLDWCI
jgi:GH35 family endo-1,4-beta-xylanase